MSVATTAVIPMPKSLDNLLMSDFWEKYGCFIGIPVIGGLLVGLFFLFRYDMLLAGGIIGGLLGLGLIISCFPYGICCPQNVLGDQVQGGPPQGNAAPRARLVDYDPARANV